MKVARFSMLLLYPRLREFPPDKWQAVLNEARGIPFDTIEWVGIMAGIGFVTWLLGLAEGMPASHPLPLVYVVRFLAAFPLVAIVAGPFLLRRTRRGLQRELQRAATACGRSSPSSRERAA